MDVDMECLEENNLNQGLSYLKISTDNLNDNNNNFNNNSNMNDVSNSLNNNVVDDDVLFVGTSITVKKENDPALKNIEYINNLNNSNNNNEDNKEYEKEDNKDDKKSGWLLSRLTKTPKAHFIKDLNSIKRDNKYNVENYDYNNDDGNIVDYSNLIDLKDYVKNKTNSQSSTISNNTNNSIGTNYYNSKKNKKNKRNILKEFNNQHNLYHTNYPYYTVPYNNQIPLVYGNQLPYLYNPLYNNTNNEYNDLMYNNNNKENNSLLGKITPEFINKWVKTIFNIFITFVLLYLLVVIIINLKNDIKNHIQRSIININNESLVCMNEYNKNKCSTMNIPAMEGKCKEWELCMNKKNMSIYRDISVISIEFIGLLINKLINQLDIKSLLFIFILIILLILFFKYNSSSSKLNSHSHYNGLYHSNYPYLYSFNGNGNNNNNKIKKLGNKDKRSCLNRYFVPNYINRNLYPHINK